MAQDIAKDMAPSCGGSLQTRLVPGKEGRNPLASLEIGMVHGLAMVVSLLRVGPSRFCQSLP